MIAEQPAQAGSASSSVDHASGTRLLTFSRAYCEFVIQSLEGLTLFQERFLFLLLTLSRQTGYCWMTQARMAEELRISVRSVEALMKWARDEGYLFVERVGFYERRYRLDLVRVGVAHGPVPANAAGRTRTVRGYISDPPRDLATRAAAGETAASEASSAARELRPAGPRRGCPTPGKAGLVDHVERGCLEPGDRGHGYGPSTGSSAPGEQRHVADEQVASHRESEDREASWESQKQSGCSSPSETRGVSQPGADLRRRDQEKTKGCPAPDEQGLEVRTGKGCSAPSEPGQRVRSYDGFSAPSEQRHDEVANSSLTPGQVVEEVVGGAGIEDDRDRPSRARTSLGTPARAREGAVLHKTLPEPEVDLDLLRRFKELPHWRSALRELSRANMTRALNNLVLHRMLQIHEKQGVQHAGRLIHGPIQDARDWDAEAAERAEAVVHDYRPPKSSPSSSLKSSPKAPPPAPKPPFKPEVVQKFLRSLPKTAWAEILEKECGFG